MSDTDYSELAKLRLGSMVAGKYHLRRILGVGGMGAVYEASHTFTERDVAVKLLHEDFAALPTVAKRFLAEAKATIGIKHPSIVEVIDAGQERDGKLYLVFEMLRGKSFASALRSKALGLDELVEIFAYLFDALAAAHDRGVVHRDVKPENVYVCEDEEFPGRIKLIDFGIARRVTGKVGDGLTQVGAVLGTPLYMSPELMMGEAVDVAADLWAMGVMMYRSFGGRLPFKGKTPEALLRAIVMQQAPVLSELAPNLPLELVSIVERSLHVDRKKRWPDAREVGEALRRFAPHIQAPYEDLRTRETTEVYKRDLAAMSRRRGSDTPATGNDLVAPTPATQAWAPAQIEQPKQHAWESALGEIEGEIAALEKTSALADDTGPAKPRPPTARPKRPKSGGGLFSRWRKKS